MTGPVKKCGSYFLKIFPKDCFNYILLQKNDHFLTEPIVVLIFMTEQHYSDDINILQQGKLMTKKPQRYWFLENDSGTVSQDVLLMFFMNQTFWTLYSYGKEYLRRKFANFCFCIT